MKLSNGLIDRHFFEFIKGLLIFVATLEEGGQYILKDEFGLRS